MNILIEQDHLLQHHIRYGYGHAVCRIELVEGYFCQRNTRHADAPAVSKTQILSLSVGHNSQYRYALLITMASGTFASAWEGWSYLIWRQKRRPRAPFLVKGTFASLIILLLLSSVVEYVGYWKHFQIFCLIFDFHDLALPTPGFIFPRQLFLSTRRTLLPTIKL